MNSIGSHNHVHGRGGLDVSARLLRDIRITSVRTQNAPLLLTLCTLVKIRLSNN